MRPEHERDEDCTVVDGMCVGCGVSHVEQCGKCSGRGFHRPGCVESDEWDGYCEVCEESDGTLCPECHTVLCADCAAQDEHALLHDAHAGAE